MLGLGVISDKKSRKGREVKLCIQRLGIVKIEVINGVIYYPIDRKFTNKLRQRIEDYIL